MRSALPKAMEGDVKAEENKVMVMAKVKAMAEGKVSSRAPRSAMQPCSTAIARSKVELCGYTSHCSKSCSASGQTCTDCGKGGQFQSVCTSQRRGVAQDEVTFQESNYQFSDASEQYYLGTVDYIIKNEDAWYVPLKITTKDLVKFKIDTGADITVMSKDAYTSVQDKPSLSEFTVTLTSPGGNMHVER